MKESITKKRFPTIGHHLMGQRVVVHGHPYNLAIHKLIEERLGDAGVAQIHFVAYQTMRQMLDALKAGGLKGFELREAIATLFQENGYGILELSGLTEHGGEVIVIESHFGLGWYSRYGRRTKPVCHFIRGFLTALMEIVYDLPPGRCCVTEVNCFVDTLDDCHFHIEVQP